MGVVYAAYDPQLDRKIALKLLAPRRRRVDPEELIHEARAMARLTHPNVVAVHDAGVQDDLVFIAMENVEGPTLHRWLREKTRSVDDVLRVVGEAARGLAAAHRVGIIHRDFKPKNVLLDPGGAEPPGTAKVMDFGLAVSSDAASTTGSQDHEVREIRPGGTVGYMSPEQLSGKPLDPRSDQFSLAVTFFEALHGKRPFQGMTAGEYLQCVLAQDIHAIENDGRTTRRMNEVLRRGLAVDPSSRYPTVEAFLDALTPPLRRNRGWWGAAGAIVVAAGAVIYQAGESSPCTSVEERLHGFWDLDRRQGIEQAILDFDQAYAEDVWRAAEPRIDAYAQSWARGATDACRATRVREEQSETRLQRRMACYDQRKAGLETLLLEASSPDASTLENLYQAVTGLEPLESCEGEQLGAEGSVDPASTAAGREALARAAVLVSLNQLGRARKSANEALRSAEGASDKHTAARIHELLGRIAYKSGDLVDARRHAERELELAAEVSDDGLVAVGWMTLADYVSATSERDDEAAHWLRAAKVAAIEADDPEVDQQIAMVTGLTASRRGDFEASLVAFRRVLELSIETDGPGSEAAADAYNNLGAVLERLGRSDEAAEATRQALEIHERLLGSEHPSVALDLSNLAMAYDEQGKTRQAVKLLRRALAIADASFAEDTTRLVRILINLGSVLVEADEVEEASEVLGRATMLLDPDHPYAGYAHGLLGSVRRKQGRLREARDHLQISLARPPADAQVRAKFEGELQTVLVALDGRIEADGAFSDPR
jgi:tetratricopeptide (TPR) repeat protein/tRNA A-37 threonylcarbamoyl transferase component Bud32